jgi:hypothetical protein
MSTTQPETGELIVRCPERLAMVRAFADAVGVRENFEYRLSYCAGRTYFGHPFRTTLSNDFAPYSFFWVNEYQTEGGEWKQGMHGGLIYHGPTHKDGTADLSLLPEGKEAEKVFYWGTHT